MKIHLRTRENVYDVSTTAAKSNALNAADVSTAASNIDALGATDASTGDKRHTAANATITRAMLRAASTKADDFARKLH